VQLIEDRDRTAKKFWALPEAVTRDLDAKNVAAVAQSKKHLLHPAVGYRNVPEKKRPTYEGSAAQQVAEEKQQQAQGSSGDDELESGGDEDAADQTNASRSRPESPLRKRQKVNAVELVEDEEIQVHDVKVVFGADEGDATKPELWIGVNVSCRGKNNVRLQFIEVVEDAPGMYMLSGTTDTFTHEQVEHTFHAVEFRQTTTYKMGKGGRRVKSNPDVKTVTTAPLDPVVLADLLRRAVECAEDIADD
jgi:hypothetical protein